MRSIKVGFIVDNFKVDSKYLDLIKWIDKEDNFVLKTLISQEMDLGENSISEKIIKIFRNFKNEGFSKIYFKINKIIEFLLLSKNEKSWVKFSYNPKDYFEKTIIVKPNISKSALVYKYSVKSLDDIRNDDLDIIVRAGSGILKGDVLKVSLNGIISFHHGDNLLNRGGPPGFWEVIQHNPESGFTIQKLTEEIDGGEVLKRGSFRTKGSWLKNKINVEKKANFYLKQLLKFYVLNNSFPKIKESFPYSFPLYKVPNIKVIFIYQLSTLFRILKKIIRKLFKIKLSWSVYYQNCAWNNLVMWKAKKIPNPRGSFLADPFCFNYKSENYIFLEEYSYKEKKGFISAYVFSKNKISRIGKVLEEKFHLSYPFVFEYENNIYMIPECSQSNSVRLYKSSLFPTCWHFERNLIENVSAADATLLEKDGLWWMFVNIDPIDNKDHCSELSIFYTDHPINGKWTPHLKNPILTNPTKARMGGFVFKEKKLYRVSQCQGFLKYGEKVHIHEIKCLDQHSYEEEIIFTNYPNFKKGITNTHHLNCFNDFTVFDAAEYRIKI